MAITNWAESDIFKSLAVFTKIIKFGLLRKI